MILVLSVVACLCPCFAFFLILIYFENYRKPIICAMLFGLAMGAIFFTYRADAGADINRHMMWLSNYKNIPLWQCFNAGHYENLFVWDIWCWIIAQTNNIYLLPASSAFLTWGMAMYMVFDSARRYNADLATIVAASCLVLCVLQPRGIVSGIRSSFAFMLCSTVFYLYWIKGRKILLTAFLLICATLVHPASLISIPILFIIPLFFNYPKTGLIVLFVGGVSIGGISSYLVESFPTANNIVISIFLSALSALQENMELNIAHSLNVTVNKWWEIGVCILMFLRVGVGVKAEYGKQILPYESMHERNQYLFALLSFSVVFAFCLTMGQSEERFLALSEMLLVPCIISQFTKVSFLSRKYLFLDLCISVGAVGLLALHIYTLVWGTASTQSLLWGFLSGALGSILINV